MDNIHYITYLIVKKKTGEITAAEEQELHNWLKADTENAAFLQKLMDKKYIHDKIQVYQLFNKEKVWNVINQQIPEPKIIKLSTRKLLSYVASLLIPLMLISGAAFYYLNIVPAQNLAQIDTVIQPGEQKATLILSDGTKVDLQKDSLKTNIKEKTVRIARIENLLSYEEEESKKPIKQVIYNTLLTPRGGTYSLKLADGTRVWLNANSSLKYPVSFSDSTRQVFLEGEAYFDVTHTGKPFIVNSENMDIRVLGTKFNVTAYTNELHIKATLVEGKVQVSHTGSLSANSKNLILTPNDQAVLSKGKKQINVQTVNTSYFTSWIDGKLEFDNASLDVVMKRLARWYDFEYSFKNTEAMQYHFSARLDNKENISEILKMLELTTNVKFKLKDKTIVIL